MEQRLHRLSFDVKQTMECVKEAYDAEQLYPVNPNLVLSIDDTTLFVFEGSAGGKEDWEWEYDGGLRV